MLVGGYYVWIFLNTNTCKHGNPNKLFIYLSAICYFTHIFRAETSFMLPGFGVQRSLLQMIQQKGDNTNLPCTWCFF